ncbi:hypothetical protein [Rheinheimera sp. 4Y26]|uniref:hypothetical protein n=1 Tax=Rheinheimera sp. 4Y26 TaxID=2977811 RepID=UPI0021B10C5F|nr:hypothetical protein [Rheinheimera sp. 4Y26]MCT6699238.1 hypothetical protein [Rheinheimera sp. 4Y26]
MDQQQELQEQQQSETTAQSTLPQRRQLLSTPAWQPKSRRQQRRQKTTSSAKERQLDMQIWLLHQAMVEKLLAQPQQAARIAQQLDERYQQGLLRHGEYLFWSSALIQLDKPELFRQSLLGDDAKSRKYRRRTALCALLTEAERQAILTGLPPVAE